MVKTVPQDGVDAVQFSLDEAHIVFFFRFVALAFFTFGVSLRAPRRFQCATERSFETLLGAFLVECVVSCVSLPWSPSLNGTSTKTPSASFFRVPYFDSTPAALDLLQSRGILVFGVDLWAADWENMTPEQELKKVIEQLEITQKGIILLHDPRARRTAAMMPTFLRYLHDQGYRIVHLVPAAAPVQKHADGAPH